MNPRSRGQHPVARTTARRACPRLRSGCRATGMGCPTIDQRLDAAHQLIDLVT
jgi:hypothetical protein